MDRRLFGDFVYQFQRSFSVGSYDRMIISGEVECTGEGEVVDCLKANLTFA
jgi:hypothetical protein